MDTPRTPITEEQCASLLNGVTIAMREYNKQFVRNCIRIESNKVPLYIFGEGHISQERPINTAMKWLEERGLYHSKESSK